MRSGCSLQFSSSRSFRFGFKIVQMGASDGLTKQASKTNAFSNKFLLLRFEYGQSKKSKFKDSLRILAAWLPYIVLLYPGVLYWDTGVKSRSSSESLLSDRSRARSGITILSSIPIYTEDSFGSVMQLPVATMWGFSYTPLHNVFLLPSHLRVG